MSSAEWGEERRGVADALARALARHSVVLIVGPDHVGKSVLARRAFDTLGSYVDFGKDQNARQAAAADPTAFLRGLPPASVIDDVHLVPALFSELQAHADRIKNPGAILAVASDAGMLEVARSSAPSRLPRVRVSSLTQSELRDRTSRLIPAAFAGDPADWSFEAIDLSDYVEYALAGGLPDLYGLADASLRSQGYAQTVDQLLATVSVEESTRLCKILELCADRPNAFISVDRDASELAMRAAELQSGLETLEALGLLRLSPAWTRFRRAEGSLRAYFRDGGYLEAVASRRRDNNRPPAAALVLRTLVAQELYTQNEWARHPVTISFWRSKPSQYDVDFLLEDASGSVVPVNVSTSLAPGAGEFVGIDAFRRRHPRAYRRGLVLYPGDRIRPLAESRWAVPLSVLWTVADQEMPLEVASLDTELEAAASALRLLVNRTSVPDVLIAQHRMALQAAMRTALQPRLERIALVLGSLGLAAEPAGPLASPAGADDDTIVPAWFEDLRTLLTADLDAPQLVVVAGLEIHTAGAEAATGTRWVAFVSAIIDQPQQVRWQAGHALLPGRPPPGRNPVDPMLVGVAGPVLARTGEVAEAMLDQLSASLASSLPDAMAALTTVAWSA